MEPHCCGTTGENVMRDCMKLREIVIESGRFIKKHWRCLTFFLLAFYLPFATFTCMFLRLLNVPRLFNLHHPLFLITVTLILVLYVALYYLQLTATILVWGAPFHSPLEDSERTPESNQQLLTASLHSARRMLLTDMLTLAIFSLASFLFTIILTITFIIWINLVMSNSVTIWIPVLSYTMEFETIAFMIWVIHFTLKVSLTRPVATMEHLWGMAAIRRSEALVRGRKMTAITALISVSVYVYASTDERFEALLSGIFARWTHDVGSAAGVSAQLSWQRHRCVHPGYRRGLLSLLLLLLSE
ncbi:hypothetical protein M758_N012100 [Ceratodon purpureus]|nr:hypothetical protein M758_N012100 [Ceratodon purpureus]